MKIKKALVIGPSGIGQAHIRELLKTKISEIALYGKKYKKKRFQESNILKAKHLKKRNFKNLNQIKNYKPDITCICSPLYMHFEHIKKCYKYSKKIIIEKPFFWLKAEKKKNIEKQTLLLLNKLKNKAIINLPMISLARQLLNKNEIPKKIKKFKFEYYTKGKQTFDEIPIDLLPHAISFFLTIKKRRKINFIILNVKKNKFSWSTKIIINNTVCEFLFSQDRHQNESQLKFKINNHTYKRKQIVVQNEYINTIIKNHNKKIKIKNPMSESINQVIKSSSKKLITSKNHEVTYEIAKLTNKLINWNKMRKLV